jgi:transcription initiation factor TFIIIB Brf1 subunit/transcription initiation factor TFIIB
MAAAAARCDCFYEGLDPLVVLDYASAAEVCTRCGVVVESQVFDEGLEYLEDSRAGPAPRPFLGHGGGTFFGAGPVRGVSQRVLGASSDFPSRLAEGFGFVEQHALALSFATDSRVVLAAKELYRDLYEKNGIKGDKSLYAAAAVYFGAKMEQASRELKLVAAACGFSQKQMHGASDAYKEHLSDKAYHDRLFTSVSASHLINAYGDRLRTTDECRKAVKRGAHRLDAALKGLLDTGRKPSTVCAGLMFLAARAEGVNIPKRTLVDACGVCQQTLDRMVLEMCDVMAANGVSV